LLLLTTFMELSPKLLVAQLLINLTSFY
jgi:hypothetical protein